MTVPASDPAAELLAELGWLRMLARRLVHSHDAADDLVQDACCAALAQRRTHGRLPQQWRAWLATVVHNLARAAHRRDAARQQREAARAAIPDDGDAARLVQRAEAQQRLVAAVLALPEPYRATVLLRFFDGLPPRRIAARHGVSVATVHSRLQRALQQLREQLDGELGGRANWLSVLAPVAWPSLLVPTPIGVLLMQTKTMLAAAAVAIACSVPLWWPGAKPAADPDLAASARKDPDAGATGGGSGGAATSRAPAAERSLVTPGPRDEVPAAATYRVDGRVCDCRGQAVAAVPIACGDADAVVATSDAAGAFTFELTASDASLAAAGKRFVTVLRGAWSREATITPVVVVAGALAIGGRVVDEHGAPVAAAEVTLQLPSDFDARFPVPLDRSVRDRWLTRSQQDGTFHLPRVPGIDGAVLMFVADAFAPGTVPLPMTDHENIQVVLKRFAFAEGELRGRVVDAAGAPAPGARVVMGVTSTVTDEQGTFGISLKRAGWPTSIVAAKAGYLPARLDVPRSGGTRIDEWPQDIVLRLGNAPKAVRGRVVDQDGRAIPGSEVWLADPTPLGIAGMLPLHVEYLIAGGNVPPEAGRMNVPFADDPTQKRMATTQGSNEANPTACFFFVKADAQGAFELPGLLDRTYTLRAFDPTTGSFGEVADAAGESYQQITIRRDHVWPVLRGRVVSQRGEPLAGVRIEQQFVTFRAKARVPGGTFENSARRDGRSATTAADGTFELNDVGSRDCSFALSGDPIVPSSIAVGEIADPLHSELRAEARCQIEVALLDPNEADHIGCEDGAGAKLPLAVLRRDSQHFTNSLELHDGRSGLFVVGERAAKILLRRAGTVVRTIPIAPDPHRTATVQ